MSEILKPSGERYLRVLQQDIATYLVPELKTARTKQLADMMGQMLEYLIKRETSLQAAALDYAAAADGAMAKLRDALPGTAPAAILPAMFAAQDAKLAQETLRTLIDAEEKLDAAAVGSDVAGRDRAFAVSGGQGVGLAGAGGTVIEATSELVTAFLARHWPGIVCTRLDLIPGGSSKDIFLVTTAGVAGLENLVIRMDQPLSSLDYTVADEFALLQALYKAGLLVPETLLFEGNPAVLGAPFMVMRRLPGEAASNLPKIAGEVQIGIAHQLANFLARMHSLDLRSLPIKGANRTGAEIAPYLVDELQNIWEKKRLAPNPLMEYAFAWLRHNMPAPIARPVLVHADCGFHNLLVKDGQVTTVLDWEFAHPGDPAEDLSYARPFLEGIMPFEDFLAAYRAAGGQEWDEQRLLFYRVLSTLRISIGCHSLLHAVETGRGGVTSKLAFTGTSYGRRFLIEAVRPILQN